MEHFSQRMPEILKTPTIFHNCYVSVQEGLVKGKKPRKIARGDLRISSNGELVLTGVIMGNDKRPFFYRTLYENIDIFPQKVYQNSDNNYGEFCCLYVYSPGKFSVKFFNSLIEIDPDLANQLSKTWKII